MNRLFSHSLLRLTGVSFLLCSSQLAMALVPNNVAIIVNSGSTNTIGYRIYVSPSGEVNYVDGKGSNQGKLSEKLTKNFFRDLKVAEPLSNLPGKQSCVKSVSFGTITTIRFAGEDSQDISCPGNNAKAQRLDNDVIAIAKALNVVNVPRSQGKPLPPQNF
ncbi:MULTISPECIES: hypothetical protein [unclassified Nostoc]|uniref:hypothetical protein n=1 Tax=unclassified Nostoc TaxID=2593658 RepID=UPI002611586F|nr:hypothetical protein [Nostoc sp. S13]MDF5738556.1 hypothetical protein [Nostoc sp. S13]